MAQEIKDKYFKETYQYLLQLEDKNKEIPLDTIFENINKFVEEGFDKNKDNSKNDKKEPIITTTQLRNIYAKIVPINSVTDLKMLRPNFIYVAARQNTQKAKDIILFFDKLIKDVNSLEQLKSFKKVMEAVVAYHKFHFNK